MVLHSTLQSRLVSGLKNAVRVVQEHVEAIPCLHLNKPALDMPREDKSSSRGEDHQEVRVFSIYTHLTQVCNLLKQQT